MHDLGDVICRTPHQIVFLTISSEHMSYNECTHRRKQNTLEYNVNTNHIGTTLRNITEWHHNVASGLVTRVELDHPYLLSSDNEIDLSNVRQQFIQTGGNFPRCVVSRWRLCSYESFTCVYGIAPALVNCNEITQVAITGLLFDFKFYLSTLLSAFVHLPLNVKLWLNSSVVQLHDRYRRFCNR